MSQQKWGGTWIHESGRGEVLTPLPPPTLSFSKEYIKLYKSTKMNNPTVLSGEEGSI